MIADIMPKPRVVFFSGLRFLAVEVFEQQIANSHSLITAYFTDQIACLFYNRRNGQTPRPAQTGIAL